MNYRLRKDGQETAAFTLQELRRRRDAGELTGNELIAVEGTDQWNNLNQVLQAALPRFLPPPPLPPAQKKSVNWMLIAVLILAGGLFITFAIVAGLAAYRGVQLAGPLWRRVQTNPGRSVAGQPGAIAAASRPVTWTTNTQTWLDVQKAKREFRIRQYLEGYQQRGIRNPEYDLLAQQFLTNWIAANFGGQLDTNQPSLTELGDRLANDPAGQDPIILTIAAVNGAELHETIRRLERAAAGFENSKHRGYPKFYATVTLASDLIQDRAHRLPVLDAQALQHLRTAFADGSLQPGDQALVGDLLINGWASGFRSRNAAAVLSLVQEQGDAWRWLALVLEGENEINEAWRARGGGYVDTVSDSGWKGFNTHLAAARKCLTSAWQLYPEQPLAPCLMIYVSLGDSDIDEMRSWFDRTTAAQIDYAGAWKEMRWGLRPRWYGDYDSMLAFGVTALQTRRFDTEVPRMFFDSLSDLETEMDLPAGQHLYARDDIWPRLQDMYEGYIAAPATTGEGRTNWRTTYAAVAALAGKYDVARQQLEALDWRPHTACLTGWNRDLSLLPLEVAARTGSRAAEVKTAESHRESGDLAGALNLYRKLSEVTDADAQTRAFVQDRLACLTVEQRLQAGDWVDFLPTDATFTGWHVGSGKFKRLPDGALEAASDQYGHLIFSRVRMGEEFEARGEFEVVSSTTKAFQAGLVMGTPQRETYNWYAFRVKRNLDEGEVASFSQHWTTQQVMAPAVLNSYTNSFDFRFEHGRVSATVDGRAVLQDVAPPVNISVSTNEFLLGLGAFNDSNSTVIRYRHVQVRWLPAR